MKEYFFILMLLFFAGCSQLPHKKFSKTGEFFGSTVQVDVCYTTAQKTALQTAADKIWARFADIHWRLSVYDPKSDLNRINHSYPNTIKIGPDTYKLIQNSLDYYQISDGMFDISIYPLLQLWKTAEKRNRLPTTEEILQVRTRMSLTHIQLLPNNQIKLLNPDLKLSIDSIADGYAGDEAARILREHGFKNFLIDATGELYAGGHNCHGKAWRVGVKNPSDPDELMEVIEISNAAVTTSGNYERFYTVDGQRYSHIIDPKNGYPHNELLSATVIAPNAENSDFWSTVLCLLEPQRGIELIDSLGPGYASIVVVDKKNGRLVKKTSRHYKKYRILPKEPNRQN